MGCCLTWETFCADGELEFALLRSRFLLNMKITVVITRKFIFFSKLQTFNDMIILEYQNSTILLHQSFCCIRCWLQIDRAIMLGQYTPIALMVIITIMLIEAAGSVDESTMKNLPRKYKIYLLKSQFYL